MQEIAHATQLVQVLSGYFDNQECSDIQVWVKNNRVLHCHRFVLMLWSDVWAAALEDKKETSLDLTAHDEPIVEMCLKYCYTSTISLNDDNLPRVHLFAHQYNLKALQHSCEQELAREPSIANCMVRYCHLSEYEFPNLPTDLRRKIKDFVCRHFVAATKVESFTRIPVKLLCDFLQEENLRATEDEVLDACCLWLGDSPEPQVRERVLKLVRLPMLSVNRLLEFRSHKFFQHDLDQRYMFAMEFILAKQVGKKPPTCDNNGHREILTLRFVSEYEVMHALTIFHYLDLDKEKTEPTWKINDKAQKYSKESQRKIAKKVWKRGRNLNVFY